MTGPVRIEVGPTADEQEGGFTNATLQHDSSGDVAFSVATRVQVPHRHNTPAKVAAYLDDVLQKAARAAGIAGVIEFDVQVGREDRP